MKSSLKNFSRHFLLFVVLSAGLLSMTNIDVSWYPVALTVDKNHGLAHNKSFWPKMGGNKIDADSSSVAQFKALLGEDDLADQNPFSNLSSEDPFVNIYKSGIVRFQRQTLRSRSYRDESGYDLVHYEIEQTGGFKSHVLAYLDRGADDLENSSGEPSVRAEVPVVVVIKNSEADAEYAVYRDGALVESSHIPVAQAESVLSQRLSNGIPFLSVSR